MCLRIKKFFTSRVHVGAIVSHVMLDLYHHLPRELQVSVLKYFTAPQRIVLLGEPASRSKLCSLIQKPGAPVKSVTMAPNGVYNMYTCNTPTFAPASLIDCNLAHTTTPTSADSELFKRGGAVWIVVDVQEDTSIFVKVAQFWLQAKTLAEREWHLILNMESVDWLTPMQHWEITRLGAKSTWVLDLDVRTEEAQQEIRRFLDLTIHV